MAAEMDLRGETSLEYDDGTGCPVGEEADDNNGDVGGDNDNYDGTGCPVGEEDGEGVGREPCEAFDGIVDHGTSCNLI